MRTRVFVIVSVVVGLASVASAKPTADYSADAASDLKESLSAGDATAIASHFKLPVAYDGIVAGGDAACAKYLHRGVVKDKAELLVLAACLAKGLGDRDVLGHPSDAPSDHLVAHALHVFVPRGARVVVGVAMSEDDEDGVEGGVVGGVVDSVTAKAAELATAIHAKDAKAAAATMTTPLVYAGLTMHDDCAKTFADRGVVRDAAQLAPFAACLFAADGVADDPVVGHELPEAGPVAVSLPKALHTVHVYVAQDSQLIRVIVQRRQAAPGGPLIVAPSTLQGNRIVGDPRISPDDKTAKAIHASGKHRVIASVRMCIDTTGDVTFAKPVKSSGFPAYDQELVDAIMTWKYKPWTVDGKAVFVCTAITFIYQQS